MVRRRGPARGALLCLLYVACAKAATRWHVWPLTVFLALVGAGGLVRFIYKGWWLQVLVMLAWLGLLWVIGGSSRIAWKQRRANRQ